MDEEIPVYYSFFDDVKKSIADVCDDLYGLGFSEVRIFCHVMVKVLVAKLLSDVVMGIAFEHLVEYDNIFTFEILQYLHFCKEGVMQILIIVD